MPRTELEVDFIKKEWYVVLDDTVGGYCIASVNKPVSKMDYNKGEAPWIDIPTRSLAQYLVDLHNKNIRS